MPLICCEKESHFIPISLTVILHQFVQLSAGTDSFEIKLFMFCFLLTCHKCLISMVPCQRFLYVKADASRAGSIHNSYRPQNRVIYMAHKYLSQLKVLKISSKMMLILQVLHFLASLFGLSVSMVCHQQHSNYQLVPHTCWYNILNQKTYTTPSLLFFLKSTIPVKRHKFTLIFSSESGDPLKSRDHSDKRKVSFMSSSHLIGRHLFC